MKYIKNEIKRAKLNPKTHTWISPNGTNYILKIPNSVYPPREDTDLLAETISNFGSGIGKKILEIGCGSGVVSIFAKTCGWEVIGCDINPLSIVASRGLAKEYGINDIEFIEGGIEPQPIKKSTVFSKGKFDLIVWNLPYLEKPNEDELLGPLEDASLADIGNDNILCLPKLLIKRVEKEKCLKDDGALVLIHNDKGKGRTLT